MVRRDNIFGARGCNGDEGFAARGCNGDEGGHNLEKEEVGTVFGLVSMHAFSSSLEGDPWQSTRERAINFGTHIDCRIFLLTVETHCRNTQYCKCFQFQRNRRTWTKFWLWKTTDDRLLSALDEMSSTKQGKSTISYRVHPLVRKSVPGSENFQLGNGCSLWTAAVMDCPSLLQAVTGL